MSLPRGVAVRPVVRRDRTHGDDLVAVEEPLEIRVASDPLAITMRTPGEDSKLALGFLYAEGIVRSIADVGTVSHCGRPGEEGYGNAIEVTPASGARLPLERAEASRRGTLTTASCGVCGRRQIDDLLAQCPVLTVEATMAVERVVAAAGQLVQPNFQRTGGTHAAAVLSAEGRVLAAQEDVGRHNAVDKVVGRAVIAEELPLSDRILVVSGRVGFEIAQKAAVAGIPVLAGVSAPSSLAIDLAQELGLTLIAFLRGERFNVYTHPDRLV